MAFCHTFLSTFMLRTWIVNKEREKKCMFTERSKQKVPQGSEMLLSANSIPGTYLRVILLN